MKRRWKTLLGAIGALVVIVGVAVAWFMHRFTAETSVMTPAPTSHLVDNVYAIQDEFVNMFLIEDSGRYIAIDAGKDIDIVRRELARLQVPADSVVAVLLTHTDMDHVAALPLFPHAVTYLASAEVDMLTGKQQKVPFYSNSMPREDYAVLSDGQVLNLGNVKVQCILTPGHTRGSMCYKVDDRYLFTGDILSLKDGLVGPSVEFFDMDHDAAIHAITTVKGLAGVQYLFTAHHGFSPDYSAAFQTWDAAKAL